MQRRNFVFIYFHTMQPRREKKLHHWWGWDCWTWGGHLNASWHDWAASRSVHWTRPGVSSADGLTHSHWVTWRVGDSGSHYCLRQKR